ncbi:MAG: 2-oxoacid:acceptor oxidoreductase family protein [Syntrophobacterales bacterium]|nr:MAG: 2-oxoacid:acceptor oxidoreductase family protein [Syntrophobacterales bacterium]
MIEVRIHGRGGQGAVIASEILATASFYDGKFCQSFPAFGVERRGAPVTAFTRIDDKYIRIRTQIYAPDHIIVLDQTLLTEGVEVTGGLKHGGWIVVNSRKDLAGFPGFNKYRVATVDANSIAMSHGVGTSTAPVVNTTILGAFVRVTELVTIDSVIKAIKEIVPTKRDQNALAAQEAYEKVFYHKGSSPWREG